MSKCIKENNKVVLFYVPLSSCCVLVQSVVYLITPLPRFLFSGPSIVFRTALCQHYPILQVLQQRQKKDLISLLLSF